MLLQLAAVYAKTLKRQWPLAVYMGAGRPLAGRPLGFSRLGGIWLTAVAPARNGVSFCLELLTGLTCC